MSSDILLQLIFSLAPPSFSFLTAILSHHQFFLMKVQTTLWPLLIATCYPVFLVFFGGGLPLRHMCISVYLPRNDVNQTQQPNVVVAVRAAGCAGPSCRAGNHSLRKYSVHFTVAGYIIVIIKFQSCARNHQNDDNRGSWSNLYPENRTCTGFL